VKADEQDAYSRYWRPMIFWKRGQLAAIKRRTHKRERREAREQIREREA
jgi:hypothetical protein